MTDACSSCISFKEQIKLENDPDSKAKIMIELHVHKLRADTFFSKLRDNTDRLQIFSFDCQKNLVVPKVPDQCACHSRQLYTYNFTVVKVSSKDNLSKDNVEIYTWNGN